MISSSLRLRVVDHTTPLAANRSLTDLGAGEGNSSFLRRIRLLPTFARTYAAHQGAIGPVTTPALTRTLQRLEGKFVIANSRSAVAIPPELEDALARDAVLGSHLHGADWVAFALCEPTQVSIRHVSGIGRPGDDATRQAVFFAVAPYSLTVVVGHGSPASASDALIRERAADQSHRAELIEPANWFHVGLCIRDTDALQQMSEATALFYRSITGRLGAGSVDTYWHLDAWEQYTEPGRIRGVIVPEMLRQPLLSTLSRTGVEEGHHLDDVLFGDRTDFAESRWPPMNRAVQRPPLVPPGYCFVEFGATIAAHVCVIDR